jgi:16S rRNA U516 pseudouridylate synthase RsuA-like enzyme
MLFSRSTISSTKVKANCTTTTKSDEILSLEALTEYQKRNVHITMQTEVGFLNKPKDEIERIEDLHITRGDLV